MRAHQPGLRTARLGQHILLLLLSCVFFGISVVYVVVVFVFVFVFVVVADSLTLAHCQDTHCQTKSTRRSQKNFLSCQEGQKHDNKI